MYGNSLNFLKKTIEITMIIATDGGAGSVTSNKNLSEVRKKETIEALKIFGTPIFLDYLDGELSIEPDITSILKKNIDSIEKDLIITHPPEDYHSDHRSLSHYVKSNF